MNINIIQKNISILPKVRPSGKSLPGDNLLTKKDFVSFKGTQAKNVNENFSPFKNVEDFKICEMVIKKNYGDEYQIVPDNHSKTQPRFSITYNRYLDESNGALIYDENDKLKFIAVQEYELMGLYMASAGIKVYDIDGKLRKSLSKEQVSSLMSYRGSLAKTLNYVLRFGHKTDFYDDYIKNLDSLFQDEMSHSVFNEDTVVYRGVYVTENSPLDIKNKIQKKEAFIERGYLSTSTDKERAKHFGNYLFEIHVPKGTKYVDTNLVTAPSEHFVDEEELIFQRNTKLLPISLDEENRVFKVKLINN